MCYSLFSSIYIVKKLITQKFGWFLSTLSYSQLNQLVPIVALLQMFLPCPPLAPPPSYLLNFLLDSIIGLPIIFALLKAVALLVKKFDLTVLRSGEYGK